MRSGPSVKVQYWASSMELHHCPQCFFSSSSFTVYLRRSILQTLPLCLQHCSLHDRLRSKPATKLTPLPAQLTCANLTLANGRVLMDVAAASPGTNASFECDAGFLRVGREALPCVAAGNGTRADWDGAVPTCLDVDNGELCIEPLCILAMQLILSLGDMSFNLRDQCHDDHCQAAPTLLWAAWTSPTTTSRRRRT